MAELLPEASPMTLTPLPSLTSISRQLVQTYGGLVSAEIPSFAAHM